MMMKRSQVPERLRGAPAILLDSAWRACEGDWSRVVYQDGAITVHNHTTYTRTELPTEEPARKHMHTGPRSRKAPRVIGTDTSEADMDVVFHRAQVKPGSSIPRAEA